MRSYYYDLIPQPRPEEKRAAGTAVPAREETPEAVLAPVEAEAVRPDQEGQAEGLPPAEGETAPSRETEPAEEPEETPAQVGGRPSHTPYVRQKKRGKRQGARRSGVWAFLVCALLLVGSTAGAVLLLRGSLVPSWLAAGPDPEESRIPGDGMGDLPWEFGGEWDLEEQDWTLTLADTALPAGELGQLILTLEPRGDARLTPAQIYEKAGPSVVGVRVLRRTGIGTGTGIVLSEDGYIVTNAHVIAGALEASVLLSDDRRVEARLVGYDRETDLAVLKVPLQGLPAAVWSSEDDLQVGDGAYAIGNPLGEDLRGTMTDGIISAIDRAMDTDGGSMRLIQTTAALNPGNSGGALLNDAGQVVGVTNMKMSSGDDRVEGLGFAIPATLVKDVAEQIIATGTYAGQPMLGVRVRSHFDDAGLPDGAQVISVDPGSDAQAQGLQPGWIIREANGQTVQTVNDLLRIKKGVRAGETLTLKVSAGSEERTVDIRLVRAGEMAP